MIVELSADEYLNLCEIAKSGRALIHSVVCIGKSEYRVDYSDTLPTLKPVPAARKQDNLSGTGGMKVSPPSLSQSQVSQPIDMSAYHGDELARQSEGPNDRRNSCPECTAPLEPDGTCGICDSMNRLLALSRKRRHEYHLMKKGERVDSQD